MHCIQTVTEKDLQITQYKHTHLNNVFLEIVKKNYSFVTKTIYVAKLMHIS